jgi:hypothetical protein
MHIQLLLLIPKKDIIFRSQTPHMKKNLLSLLFILALTFSSRAQYVAIPDSNFGKWLDTAGYTTCLIGSSAVGWQLDTTCSSVVNDTLIICSNSNISNLTGIQYFRNLKHLNCGYNHLSSLPSLPAGLTYLDCYGNIFTSLPSLPAGLTTLSCGGNQLSSLASLPAGLVYLSCNSNQLTSLSLPAGLINLICSNNHLSSLPSLPAGLTYLNCANNQLSSLPSLPAGLTDLDCVVNQLSSLPSLPAGLVYLECSGNQLSSLPSLPAGLVYLECYSNQLSSLPSLPAGLITLYCDNNQLSSLPSLPAGLDYLYCDHNQLSSLPSLPHSLVSIYCRHNLNLSCLPHIDTNRLIYFYIDSTNIHCLPNRFTAQNYDIDPRTLPICDSSSRCFWPLGLSDVEQSSISLYPNPNSGSFTLQTSQQIGTAYLIYDMLGQEIQTRTISTDSEHIDMGSAAPGVYTLMIKGRNGSVRFTVMR